MATTIKVTPQELLTASTQISGLADEYKSEYEALFGDVVAMKGKWDGQDNQTYTDRVEGFRDDFTNMYNLMIQYSDYLKETGNAYQQTQTNIKNAAATLVN